MSCNEIQEKLSEWLDGRVEGAEKRLIEEHLSECARCRQVREQLLAVHQLGIKALQDYRQSEADQQALTERIMSALPARPLRVEAGFTAWLRRRRALVWRTAALAGALVVLVMITRLNYNRETLLQPIFIQDSTVVRQPAADARLQKSEKKELVHTEYAVRKEKSATAFKPEQRRESTAAAPTPCPVSISEPELKDAAQVGGVSKSVKVGEESNATGQAATREKPESATSAIGPIGGANGANPLSVYGVPARQYEAHLTQTESLTLAKSADAPSRSAQRTDLDRQFVMQALVNEFAAFDSIFADDKSDAAQKNLRTMQAAEFLYNLVITKKIKSMQETAVKFYEAHQQVLQDSLGIEKFQRQLLEIKSAL